MTTLTDLLNEISTLSVDKRIAYFWNHDVETAFPMPKQKPYDLGGGVVDQKGRTYYKVNIVVDDIFYGCEKAMRSCYFAKKLPQYHVEIANGERLVLTAQEVKTLVNAILDHYNIKVVAAYNARFDKTAIENLWAMIDPETSFYDRPVTYYDTWLMAQDTICSLKKYQKFCETYGFMTKHPKPRVKTSAEVVYRFLTNDPTFEEAHTGLRDVEIETVILAACYAKHKKMRKELGTKKSA